MAQNYTQKQKTANGYEELYPKTTAEQVVTDADRQFVSAAEKADYAGKQDALGYTPEDAAKKNQPEGYAGLDANGKLEETLLPDTLVHDKGFFATPEALRGSCGGRHNGYPLGMGCRANAGSGLDRQRGTGAYPA